MVKQVNSLKTVNTEPIYLNAIFYLSNCFITTEGVLTDVSGSHFNTRIYEVEAGKYYTISCNNYYANITWCVIGFSSTLPQKGNSVQVVKIANAGQYPLSELYLANTDGYIIIQDSYDGQIPKINFDKVNVSEIEEILYKNLTLSPFSELTPYFVNNEGVITSVSGDFTVSTYKVKAGQKYHISCNGFTASTVLTALGFSISTIYPNGTVTPIILSTIGTQNINYDYTPQIDGYLVTTSSSNGSKISITTKDYTFVTDEELLVLENKIFQLRRISHEYDLFNTFISNEGNVNNVSGDFKVRVYKVEGGK